MSAGSVPHNAGPLQRPQLGHPAGRDVSMSVRFQANLVVLLLGAGSLVFAFADAPAIHDWTAVGVGAASVLTALYSLAFAGRGAYQFLADIAIVALGAWSIVAARVMVDQSVWLVASAALGLVFFGALGLIARELHVTRGVLVGRSWVGPELLDSVSTTNGRS